MSSVLVQSGPGGLAIAGEVSPGDATCATLADIFGLDAVSSALGEQAVDEPAAGVDGGRFGVDGADAVPVASRAGAALDWDPAELLTVRPEDQDAAERVVFEADPPEWFGLQPGPELAAALSRADVGSASPTELIELMTAAQRLQGWTEALRVSAMAAFYRRRTEEAVAVADGAPGRVVDVPREVTALSGRPVRDPLRSAAAEVGAALRLAPSTAANHLETAARLCGTLPETVRELRSGRLTFSKALTIADGTAALDVDAQREVQKRLLRTAERQTPGQLRAACRRAVAEADPRSLEERHRGATLDRTVTKVPLPDGMAGLWFTHTAEQIEACWVAIQGLADLAKKDATSSRRPARSSRGPGAAGAGAGQDESATPVVDDRTAAQRRADAFADCLEGFLSNGADWIGRTLPTQHRRRPHIEVLVPYTTLLGLDDRPAELAGYGPIPASMARRIAEDGRWRRVLTDPATGTAVEAATRRHDPPARVSETLIVRDQTCRWPGCRRPARRCQRDHVPKHRENGVTQLALMAMFCEPHHDLKDFGDWIVTAEPGGVLRFQAPTGHVYFTQPPRLYPAERLSRVESDTDPPPF